MTDRNTTGIESIIGLANLAYDAKCDTYILEDSNHKVFFKSISKILKWHRHEGFRKVVANAHAMTPLCKAEASSLY